MQVFSIFREQLGPKIPMKKVSFSYVFIYFPYNVLNLSGSCRVGAVAYILCLVPFLLFHSNLYYSTVSLFPVSLYILMFKFFCWLT